MGVALVELARASRKRAPNRHGGSWVPASLLVLITLGIFLRANAIDRAAIHGRVCSWFPVTSEIAGWFRESTPGEDELESPGRQRGVLARWAIGHQLHVLGGVPVVTDPFNHRDTEDVILRVWATTSEDDLWRVLRDLDVRHLALVDPIGDIGTVLRHQGSPVSRLVGRAGPEAIALGPEWNRFAAFRLYMRQAGRDDPEHFCLRFRTRSEHPFVIRGEVGEPIPHSVARGQVYEVLGPEESCHPEERIPPSSAAIWPEECASVRQAPRNGIRAPRGERMAER